MLECSICGSTQFSSREILWDELIAAWGLSREEVEYINRQQGCFCVACRANLRVVALGEAVRDALGVEGPMTAWTADPRLAGLRVLDVNGATAISNALSHLPGYVRGNFPEVNMEALPYPAAAFDLVVHSDTLEHVPHPLRGLEECRRVLRPGGHLCFTIPVVVGRLTRSRDGLPPSWHGNSSQNSDDYLVQTEYGADMWTQVMRAGFTRVTLHQVSYPAAIAITAWTPPARN
ncbi:class I SAM-dependent methyltransferase [Azorhizobium caulinodans]|uniref:class I SAM-dependent methyltransferase n=1 Tax=Azorhizobium caulinodans TaxID=7 RepID=UPI002FBD3B34